MPLIAGKSPLLSSSDIYIEREDEARDRLVGSYFSMHYGLKRASPRPRRIGHNHDYIAVERSEKFMRLGSVPLQSYTMRASSTAGGQDKTDDAMYLPWKQLTESDMTTIMLGSKRRTRLLM